MAHPQPTSFDEYEQQLVQRLTAWSPRQRLAFAAALAERWLQAYARFSAKRLWGDPQALRQIVATLWDHLADRPMAPEEYRRFSDQLGAAAPDMEEYDERDAWKALTACRLLAGALDCCVKAESVAIATKSAMAGFEAAVGDWPAEGPGQRRTWKKPAVSDEFVKQTALQDAVGSITEFDAAAIASLRDRHAPQLAAPNRARRPNGTAKKRADLDSVDGLRMAVRGYLKRSASHRLVFAALVAERLFPHYEAFVAAGGKGQSERFREVLATIWQAARSGPLTSAALQESRMRLSEASVNKSEASAWSAWSAWRVLELALECCASEKNLEPAEEAAVVAYERVAGPNSRTDAQIWKDQHRNPLLHSEVMTQTMLLMRLSTIPLIDDQACAALRHLQ